VKGEQGWGVEWGVGRAVRMWGKRNRREYVKRDGEIEEGTRVKRDRKTSEG